MTFWPLTNSEFPTDQTFHQFHDLYTELDLHRIMSGFHGAYATGVASQQGTLTLPDTWFRPPFGTCSCSNCWDQIPRTCHVFTRLFTSNTPWYFLDFARLESLICIWISITVLCNLIHFRYLRGSSCVICRILCWCMIFVVVFFFIKYPAYKTIILSLIYF